jgi:3-methyladenine DNA glycosylase/8-oxoguanine DNA glycosylase
MKDLTQERKALKSIFKHLKREGFEIVAVEPTSLDIGEEDEILQVNKDTSFETIFDYYFEWDDDYILVVKHTEKDGGARILQTWFGGAEGLYTDASVNDSVRDEFDRATDAWYDEMEEQDIQF